MQNFTRFEEEEKIIKNNFIGFFKYLIIQKAKPYIKCFYMFW